MCSPCSAGVVIDDPDDPLGIVRLFGAVEAVDVYPAFQAAAVNDEFPLQFRRLALHVQLVKPEPARVVDDEPLRNDQQRGERDEEQASL